MQSMVHLSNAQMADYGCLRDWVPDQPACARWGGLALTWPLVVAEQLAVQLRMPDSNDRVWRDDCGGLLGFGQHWRIAADSVHIGRIILNPAWRGQGLGDLFCRALLADAMRMKRSNRVTLRVYRDNRVALHLYRQLGFVEVPEASDAALCFMQYQAVA